MSLHFEISYGSLNKYEEELCGDIVEIIKKDDDIIIVLADGLGSGVKANILASLTSKIVASMLIEASDVREVIETLALTLPICEKRKLPYSTFSFIHINSFGDAHIVEYGNPDIVIIRNGKELELFRSEIEIENKVIKESYVNLKVDDMFFIFSNGVTNAGIEKSLNLGWQRKNLVKYIEKVEVKERTPYYMQKLLLAACNSLYGNRPDDDATVVACKIRNRNIAHILVQPPIREEDDDRIIREFIGFHGIKVICGGSTAQLVSRICKKELKVLLNYITPEVPPIGYIDGIDLVTEGIVTLDKALEIIKKYENGSLDAYNSFEGKEDGASLLAKLLINQCTGVEFIMAKERKWEGCNYSMPNYFRSKFEIVSDIVESLRTIGKDADIKHY